MKTENGNGVNPALDDVRLKIETMKLLADSAIDFTEERKLKRAEINGYNKAIRDVCKVLKEHVG